MADQTEEKVADQTENQQEPQEPVVVEDSGDEETVEKGEENKVE